MLSIVFSVTGTLTVRRNDVMNKDALIGAIAVKSRLTRKDSQRALNAFIESVSEALAEKEKVTLIELGTFSVVTRAARTGRNPSTGEPMDIPAKDVPKFRPGTQLKGKVAGK
jgi:DNA-binding protein HU-beta